MRLRGARIAWRRQIFTVLQPLGRQAPVMLLAPGAGSPLLLDNPQLSEAGIRFLR